MVLGISGTTSLSDNVRHGLTIVRSWTAVDDVTGKGRGRRAPDRNLLIPSELLRDCYGVVFLFTYKGAVGLSAEFGSGFLLTKVYRGTPDEKWSGPVAVMANGLGWGVQFGASKANHIIILNNQQAADVMCAGAKLDLGGSITVAAGPVGRDLQVKLHGNQWGIAATYSYSYSQGVMMGVALNSTLVWVNPWMTHAFYGRSDMSITDILQGRAGMNAYELHPQLLDLYLALDEAMERPQKGRTVFGMGDASGTSTEEVAGGIMGRVRWLGHRAMYAARIGAASVLEAVAWWGHGAGMAVQKGAETAQAAAAKASEGVSAMAQRGSETAAQMTQSARETASAVAAKASATTEQLATKGRQAMDTAMQKGREHVEATKGGMETMAQKGREGMEAAGQKGREGMEAAKGGMESMAQKGREGMEAAGQKGREGMRGAEPMAGAGLERMEDMARMGGERMPQQGTQEWRMQEQQWNMPQEAMLRPGRAGTQQNMVQPATAQVKVEAVGHPPQPVKEALGLDKGPKHVDVAAAPAGPPAGTLMSGSG